MIMDSITENTKLDDKISEIEAELNADIYNKIQIVVVEGSDDVQFVKNNFQMQNVIVKESFSGKADLTNIVESPLLMDKRVIGIRDRDYMDTTELSEKMFCYDTCCLELMLLSNKDVRDNIFGTAYHGCKEYGHVIENALKQLAPLSVMRRENEIRGLGIKFERAGVANHVDVMHETLDFVKVYERIGTNKISYEECVDMAAQMTSDELIEVTNGHDLCNFLGVILNGYKGTMGEKQFMFLLLTVYRKSDFVNTQLYYDIKNYQEQYNLQYVD